MRCHGCNQEIDRLTRVTVSEIVPAKESHLQMIIQQAKLSDVVVHNCGAKYRATANQAGALLFAIEENTPAPV